ncbi:unnamed protein product [Prunus armeniaca]
MMKLMVLIGVNLEILGLSRTCDSWMMAGPVGQQMRRTPNFFGPNRVLDEVDALLGPTVADGSLRDWAAKSGLVGNTEPKNKGIVDLPICADSNSKGDSAFFLKFGVSSDGRRQRNRGNSYLRIEPVESWGVSKAWSFNSSVGEVLTALKARGNEIGGKGNQAVFPLGKGMAVEPEGCREAGINEMGLILPIGSHDEADGFDRGQFGDIRVESHMRQLDDGGPSWAANEAGCFVYRARAMAVDIVEGVLQ